MPTPPEFKAPFFPECFYHIVCKSIDGINLFREDIDYYIFFSGFNNLLLLYLMLGVIAF
jgi:hypothetical protein